MKVAVPKHFTLTPLLISVFGQVNSFQAAFASQLCPIAPEMMPVYLAWACAHTNAIVVEALGVQILRASAGGALVTIAVACLAGAPSRFVTDAGVTKHTGAGVATWACAHANTILLFNCCKPCCMRSSTWAPLSMIVCQ